MAKVHRVYTGKDGLTHSEEINVFPDPAKSLSEVNTQSTTSRRTARSAGFRSQASGFFADWHTVERPVYSITLSGEVEYGLTDGTKIRGGPGHTVLFEDKAGKVHTTRVISKEPRQFIGVELE